MNTWIKSILIGLAAAVICFILLLIIKDKYKKQAYEVHYELEVVKDKESAEGLNQVMEQAMHIIGLRIDQIGYSSSIRRKSANHIDIVVKHDTDIPLTTHVINSNNKLEFREVYMMSELANSFARMLTAKQKFSPGVNIADSGSVFNAKNIGSLIAFSVDASGRIIDNGIIGVALNRDTAFINRILADPEVLNLFPRDVEFLYGPGNSTNAKDKHRLVNIYAIKTKMQKAPLQNMDIVASEVSERVDGQPELLLQFSPAGSRVWERMTAENRGRYIAMIMDKKVISAPHVIDVISGGNSSITGGFERNELELLASQLNTGFIPADLHLVEMHASLEKPSRTNEWVTPLVTFLVVGGFSLLLFYSLKRK